MLLLATSINVGRARGLYGIQAPAVTGHPLFERAYRIQMNTLENMALLLPALWVNAAFVSDRGAAALGAVWLIARIWYALAYHANPSRRGPAFGVSMAAFALVWLAGLYGVGRILLHV
jgi:glutathione S-transferase